MEVHHWWQPEAGMGGCMSSHHPLLDEARAMLDRVISGINSLHLVPLDYNTSTTADYLRAEERLIVAYGQEQAKPKCDRCDGSGWLEPIGPKSDGSYITSRPCPKCDAVWL